MEASDKVTIRLEGGPCNGQIRHHTFGGLNMAAESADDSKARLVRPYLDGGKPHLSYYVHDRIEADGIWVFTSVPEPTADMSDDEIRKMLG